MIGAVDLVKRFGANTAVDRISFEIEQGEVVGFLGPNGAGKTTTIRVLTCFHPATSGTARIAGRDVYAEPVAVRRSIGYLPENVPIYPDLRVAEYLTYRAALKGVPRRKRKSAVESAMERCGVVEVRRRLVGHVSRGYRQRVGLADALVANPPILILDEPTSGLDPNQRRRMKALIRELAEQHTILFSSHILAEVEEVSSRILIISNGKLRADGTVESLLAHAPGRRLSVSAKIDGDLLRSTAESVLGIEHVEVTEEGDGWQRVAQAIEPGEDPRVELAEALRTIGAVVRELALELPTLERYFQHVTEDQSGCDLPTEGGAE